MQKDLVQEYMDEEQKKNYQDYCEILAGKEY